jgi:hypothetical protein
LLYAFGGIKIIALLDFLSQTVEKMNRAFYVHYSLLEVSGVPDEIERKCFRHSGFIVFCMC